MKITELSQIDYNDHWLIFTRYGEIGIAPKDPLWLRWIKTAFQILTLYYYDVYGHVRIHRVAHGLFEKFNYDKEQGKDLTEHYVVVINKLLSVERPIRTYREELIRVKTKILKSTPKTSF